MNGKGHKKNFVVTFHMRSTGYASCCGVYKTFEKAIGRVYSGIYNRSVDEEGYISNFHVSLPMYAEGANAWIIPYSYEDSDGDVQDDEYYLVYDNRRVE